MIINSFNAAWFLMLAVQVVLIVAITLFCKGRSEEYKEKFFVGMFIFTMLYLVVYKIYLVEFSTYETCWLNELPLNLCQVAAILMYPAVKFKKNSLKCFCFFVGFLCTLMAMAMPVEGFYDIPLLSGDSIGFYGYHGLVFVMAVCLVTLKLCRPEAKYVLGAVGLIAVIALAVHGCNFLLRRTVFEEANYFFTYDPENNPILNLLYGFIPVGYVYLLPLLPVLYPVLLGIAWVVRKLQK